MPPRSHEDSRPTPVPARRSRRQPRPRRREDRVTNEAPSRGGEDRVTRTLYAAAATPAARPASRREPTRMILPGWRHVATLAAPDIVATASFFLALGLVTVFSQFSILFVLPLLIPSLVLGALDRGRIGQGWRAAVIVNLSTMLVLFPLLVIRQSTVRVPYLDAAHGTVYAAVVSTSAVLLVLVAIALYTAWASRQDPESAPLLFLPAALLVPLLTSATAFARLEAALLIAGLIFALATALTLVASLLPPAYTVFVAPISVAFEVLFVTLVRQERIFPVGVGQAGMALFASVVIAAIVLAVVLPAISTWMLQVERLRMRALEQPA